MLTYAMIGYWVLTIRLLFDKGFAKRQSVDLRHQIITIVSAMFLWPVTVLYFLFRKVS